MTADSKTRATVRRLMKSIRRIGAILLVCYLAFIVLVYFFQRSLLFFPSHAAASGSLRPWLDGQRTIGYCREAPNARVVWLMTHGNGGQASDRDYVLGRISDQDSLYVLEYPGYGMRDGSPTMESMNRAAAEAYRLLRSRNPKVPVCVVGESIGSGPACVLAREEIPPDKIVLVAPFDSLASVASERFCFLPARLMLRDNWDNAAALGSYRGPVDIFGATGDTIIPIGHAKNLARQIPAAHFTAITGEHNDWSASDQVKIRFSSAQ